MIAVSLFILRLASPLCFLLHLNCFLSVHTLKNYGLLCPEGWIARGEAGVCEALPSYTGPCAVVNSFPEDASMKRQLEETCKVEWPTISPCEKDYEQPCPELWLHNQDDSCVAPFLYRGRCERIEKYSDLSSEEKKGIERRCGIRWPCAPLCVRNYKVSCPEGWEDAEDQMSCIAGSQYTGPCLPRMSFHKMDWRMKQLMEEHCLLSFPCAESCAADYSSPCPQGWLALSSDGSCIPPDQYKGNCEGRHQLASKSAEEKRRWTTIHTLNSFKNCQVLKETTTTMLIILRTILRIIILMTEIRTTTHDRFAVKCSTQWPCTSSSIGRGSFGRRPSPQQLERQAKALPRNNSFLVRAGNGFVVRPP